MDRLQVAFVSRIFVSYCRENEAEVRDLVQDIEGLGHDVWFPTT